MNGKRLLETRKKLGLTQSEFAQQLGLTHSTISVAEAGKAQLTETTIRLICLTFGVNEQWLRHGEGEMMAAKARSPGEDGGSGRLLDIFWQLSPRGQAVLLDIAEKLAEGELRGLMDAAAYAGEKKEQPA